MNGRIWHLAFGIWLLAIFLPGCKDGQPRLVIPAFYHWQTNLKLSEAERLYLDSLHVKKLYVKFFDVDWNVASGQPVPLAQVQIDFNHLPGLQIIPTIFITNRTLLNLPMPDVDSLAGRIFQKIQDIAIPLASKRESHGNELRITEVQFDCDWTEQTKEKYFRLLEIFKKKISAGYSYLSPHTSHLSATIRLHQVRFFEKTGVPPVDKGMLMFYNMGQVDEWATGNSILDPGLAKQYLSDGKLRSYPLELDVALPLFQWGVLFRDGRLVKLINGLSERELNDTSRFIKLAPNRFEVRKSTYLQGYYLYEGDRLRLEGVTPKLLEEAAVLLGNWFGKPNSQPELNVAFYHMDQHIFKSFPHEQLEKTLDKFR